MNTNDSRLPGALQAVLRQRCPRCRRGIVYSNASTMNRRCPYCGFGFDRELGFYSGAIWLAVLISTPVVLGILCGLLLLFPALPPQVPALLAVICYVPLLPLTARLARVLWMGIGSPFSPDDTDGPPPPPPLPPVPQVPSGPNARPSTGPSRPDRLLPAHVDLHN